MYYWADIVMNFFLQFFFYFFQENLIDESRK